MSYSPVMIEGRTIATGSSLEYCCTSCSASAFVKVYEFGRPFRNLFRSPSTTSSLIHSHSSIKCVGSIYFGLYGDAKKKMSATFVAGDRAVCFHRRRRSRRSRSGFRHLTCLAFIDPFFYFFQVTVGVGRGNMNDRLDVFETPRKLEHLVSTLDIRENASADRFRKTHLK